MRASHNERPVALQYKTRAPLSRIERWLLPRDWRLAVSSHDVPLPDEMSVQAVILDMVGYLAGVGLLQEQARVILPLEDDLPGVTGC